MNMTKTDPMNLPEPMARAIAVLLNHLREQDQDGMEISFPEFTINGVSHKNVRINVQTDGHDGK